MTTALIAFSTSLWLSLCGLPSLPQVATGTTVGVRRHLAAMGTWLEVDVEASDRPAALAASEVAIRSIEAVERRLSTWRADSELSELNRAPVGEPVALSPELARDLRAARRWWRATADGFDPSVGALVEAWGLRNGGRIPTADEIAAARIDGGLAGAIALRGTYATRLDGRARIEEGGFGKGIALDAALAAVRAAGASAATLDLGGQVATFGWREPVVVELADPRDRSRAVATLALQPGSLATSGNSERGITVGGTRLGHVLDPRTGSPARDFGSLAVWAADATTADCLSTGLYVLGPDAALEWARERRDVDVVALEVEGDLVVLRATPRIACFLTVLAEGVVLVPPERSVVERAGSSKSSSHRTTDP